MPPLTSARILLRTLRQVVLSEQITTRKKLLADLVATAEAAGRVPEWLKAWEQAQVDECNQDIAELKAMAANS